MGKDHYEFYDGELHLYLRENSSRWQCATYIGGANWRKSTKETGFAAAKEIAIGWYFDLKARGRIGVLDSHPSGKLFKEAATVFLKEYPVITHGQRNEYYVSQLEQRLNNHLIPFLGDKPVKQITAGVAVEYRIHRHEKSMAKRDKPPSRSTLHKEIVILRQVLKTCLRHGWIEHLPDLSVPYKTSGKITHRAWFSPIEYKQFYGVTRERAKNPKKENWREASENFHDYVLFMVNTGLRPDEGQRLQLRDVAIVTDEATGERILLIEVRGKRGVGYCKSMPGAVLPFTRIVKRKKLQPTDLVFGKVQNELLNSILKELNLKFDREGNRRTAYSLRHTYISFRLMEGADIYQIAKNCRTSVEMIEKYYAIHIHNTLDAAAINIRREKPAKKARPRPRNRDEPQID
ncbi:MAG TPA: site-specific integrase [Verrucomicrobiae bacterium]|nr:site-specific integrase [Verrucomicrobiae bacterium]